MAHILAAEYELLGGDTPEDEATEHAFRTAPVFTGDALNALGANVLPQRAVYGRVLSQSADGFPSHPASPILYINTNTPFSGLVCGLQGTGKSHSTSVLLESCLMADPRLGTLPEPLSALVFHFDTAAGGGNVQPCEAAYLSALHVRRGGNVAAPSVTVLVLPSNIQAMREVYAELPAVKVKPLHFSPEDINGERLLAMMKVDENGQIPLYMEAVMSLLRDTEGPFDYNKFREDLKAQPLNGTQRTMLNLRLSLLDSCLKGGSAENRVTVHFRKGQLTIIDLSSPFMDGSSACGFFDLILGLFIQADIKPSGKVVVLDEAHKYLSDAQSGTSSRLTQSLLTIIRQQRHLATRVIISTQEPTVVPSKFIALCSFIIAHRFQSPEWLRLLTKHVSVPNNSFDELFSRLTSLRTGQALMFATSGIGVRASRSPVSAPGVGGTRDVEPFGAGYLLVQSRLRVTRDGGHSILAVHDPARTTRVGLGGAEAGSDAEAAGAEAAGGRLALTAARAPVTPAETPAPRYVPPHAMGASGSAVNGGAGVATLVDTLRNSGSPPWLPSASDAGSASSSATGAATTTTGDSDDESASQSSDGTAPTHVWKKFEPLVKFLREKHDEGILQVYVWIVQKHFDRVQCGVYDDTFDETLAEAVTLGLVEHGTPLWDGDRVMLSADAEGIMQRTLVRLTGGHAHFAPLVRYLRDQAAHGFREITVATIERRLGADMVVTVGDAEAAGVVQIVPNTVKPKVMLPPNTHFVFL